MNYPTSQESGWSELLARFHIDLWLILLLVATTSLGLLVVYSASGPSLPMTINQAERFGLGLVVMIICAQFPPEFYRRLAPWLFAATLVLLCLVPIIGEHSKGAQRWLDFKVFRFQPSEIMKLAMPLAVAAFLHRRPLPPKLSTMVATLILILLPTGLVAIQPDLGTALLIVVSGVFALFFGGLGWRWIAGGIVGVAAIAPLAWYRMRDYQKQRVLTFLDPESDPLGAGYHITQSKIAIGSGGLFGKGWLQGTQAKLDFLPESHTDFIFAVFSEELGLLGILLLLSLYLAIVGRCLIIALRGQDTFQRLLAGSIGLTFFFYMFVNMGMVIGLLPVVGVPLPLVSYGGTSMVTLLTGFGLLMSIQTHRKLISN